MVYLKEILKHQKDNLLQHKNIEAVAYLYLRDKEQLKSNDFDLSPEELVSYKGYLNEKVSKEEITKIINKRPIKGLDASSNIYKLVGLYLANKDLVKQKFSEKFHAADILQKFFICKIEPKFKDNLKETLKHTTDNNPVTVILHKLLRIKEPSEELINMAIEEIVKKDLDIPTLVLLEDLEKSLLKIKYINQSAEDLVRNILKNFGNAVQKIIKDRRKEHQNFEIKDEYDVQDILYVILKSIFQNLKDEDPIPKHGGSSTRIDFILREEEILIEVKMIKEKDKDEKEFIKQLKIDIESYHTCTWLKKLFCFIYDPFNKTKDVENFNELNGFRTKEGQSFDVEIILSK